MKKLLILTYLFSFLFLPLIVAQDHTDKEYGERSWFIRNMDIANKLGTYNSLPTDLGLWEYGDFGIITFRGKLTRGDFKAVDDFKETKLFDFKSESVQSFKESGWRFYGEFTFSISSAQDAEWNQFYRKPETGSPFRFVTMRTGDWNTKHYGLKGAMSKKVNDRLSLGAKIVYSGDMYSRLSDTRNEQYNLDFHLSGSAGFSINSHQHISAGLTYLYRKKQPEFSNDYKATGEEFNIYSIYGLGNYNDAMISDRVSVTEMNPGLELSYIAGNDDVFTFSYIFYPGRERWKNIITSLNGLVPEEQYKYDYYNNQLTSTFLYREHGNELYSKINARYTSGTAYEYRESYQLTYIYDQLAADISTTLLRPAKHFFYNTDFTASLEVIDKKDMMYAHRIKYTNIGAGLTSGHCMNIDQGNRIVLDLNTFYKANIDYIHDVAAAGTMPYTLNIAYNEVAYYTSDILKLAAGIRWQHLSKKTGIELGINYSFSKPLNIKLFNDYSLIRYNTYKTFINTSLNLLF